MRLLPQAVARRLFPRVRRSSARRRSSKTCPQSIHPELSDARPHADRRRDPANLKLRVQSSVRLRFRREEQQPFPHATSLVARVSLLPPWVTIIVVTEAFPKPGCVLVHQRNAPYPFGALP